MRSQATFTYDATLSESSKGPPVIEGFRISLNSAQKRRGVDLKVNDHHSAEKVAAAEYRLALGLLGLSQLAA